jgi:hypothetical protein
MAKCAGVQPGGKEALACLQTNVSSLSAACQRVVRQTLPASAAPKQATAAPAPANAAPKPPTAEQQSAMRSACRSDFMSQCSGVQPGGKDALACLQSRVSSLSAACQKVVRETMPAGPGQPAQVVPAAVAPAAPAHMEPNPIDAVVMLRACKLDLLRHCREVDVGDGRKLACLNEHQDALTIRCRTALKVTSPLH